MTLWLSGVALLVLALAVLLPVLLRRSRLADIDQDAINLAMARDELALLEDAREQGELDDANFDAARADLERRLGADLKDSGDTAASARHGSHGTWAAVVLAFLIPVGAGGLYLWLGTPAPPTPAAVATAPQDADGARLPSVEEMISQLQARLASNPDDSEGWFLLARGHMSQRNYADAVDALKRVIEISGESAPVLVRYADALAMAHGGRLQGRPMELIQRALELEPQHPQALWLAGVGAAEGGDDRQALVYWQWAREAMTSESDRAQLDHQIAQLRARMGQNPAQAPPPAASGEAPPALPAPVATGGGGVRLRVRLDPALAERARPDQTVFIFARAPQGPPMPLAAMRHTVAELPLAVTLDDSQAMTPALKISGFRAVHLVARISSSGQPGASSGDLFGEIPLAAVGGAETLELVINQITP